MRWNDPEWEDAFRRPGDVAQRPGTCASSASSSPGCAHRPAPSDLPFQGFLRSQRGGCICTTPVVLRTADQETCKTCGAPIRWQVTTSLHNRRDDATEARSSRGARARECDDERPEYPVVTVTPARPKGPCRVCATRSTQARRRYRALARAFLAIHDTARCVACDPVSVRGAQCVPRHGGPGARCVGTYECCARKRDNVIFLHQRLLSMKRGLTPVRENGREQPCVYVQARGGCNELTHGAKQELMRITDRMGARPNRLGNLSKRNDALVALDSAIVVIKDELAAIDEPVQRLEKIATGERAPDTIDAAARLKVNAAMHVQTLVEMLVECLNRRRVQAHVIKALLSSPATAQACSVLMPYVRDVVEWMTIDGQAYGRADRNCCSSEACKATMCLHLNSVTQDDTYDVRRFWQLQIRPMGLLACLLCLQTPGLQDAIMHPQAVHEVLLRESQDAFFRSRFFAYRASHTATAAFLIARSDHIYDGDTADIEARRSDLARVVSVHSAAAVLGLWPQFFAPCFAPRNGGLALMQPQFAQVVDHQLADFTARAGSGSFDGVVVARLIVYARAGGDGVVDVNKDGVSFAVPCPPEHVMGGRNALQYLEVVRATFSAVRGRVVSAAMLRGEFRRVEHTTKTLLETTRLLSSKTVGRAGAHMNTLDMDQHGFSKERLLPTNFTSSVDAVELALQVSHVGERLSLAMPGLNDAFWPSVDVARVRDAMRVHPIAGLFVPLSRSLRTESGHYARSVLPSSSVRYDANGVRLGNHVPANETARARAHAALESASNLQPVARAVDVDNGTARSATPSGGLATVLDVGFPGRAALMKLVKGQVRRLAAACAATPQQIDYDVAFAAGAFAGDVKRMRGLIRFMVNENYRLSKGETPVRAVAYLRDSLRHLGVDDADVVDLFKTIVKCMVRLHADRVSYPVVYGLFEHGYVVDFFCQIALAHGMDDERQLAHVVMAGHDFECGCADSSRAISARERPRTMR